MTYDAVVASTPISFSSSVSEPGPKQTSPFGSWQLVPMSGHNLPAPLLWRSREKRGVAASVDIVYSRAEWFQVTDVFGAWAVIRRQILPGERLNRMPKKLFVRAAAALSG
jgi:hypothetical protein